ncbi:hypothetical protein SAZ11_15485 [Streptomyces sp. FXJ1.4098]|nr:hypothetical protein [Streptomyces sp. FXJ1.4098]
MAQPAPHHPATAEPVRDPVRPEQWRGRQQQVPATLVRTEIQSLVVEDQVADQDLDPAAQPGQDTVVRTEVQRVQADDGRFVRNLTLDLPVRFGDGFPADRLQQFQERTRALLETQVNHGLPLPRSGDQLHIDLNLIHDPGNAEAIELSATDTPAPSDQFHIRLASDDPSLAAPERDRRQARNDTTALRQMLRYAGVAPAPDALPGPAVPLDQLQTVEDLTDTRPAVSTDGPAVSTDDPAVSTDDPAAAPHRPVTATSSAFPEAPAAPPASAREGRSRLRPGPERRVEIQQAPQVGEHSADVPEESATSGWGMSRDNHLRFQAFADQGELVIDVRPRNVDSVKWLTLGALPKPEEIKAKTVNALDVRLGAPQDKRGLVGFFEPRLPEGVSADDPVLARYQQRLKEYQSLRNQMDELAAEGRYRTVGGVVHAVVDGGALRPLTGDLDIFRINRLDGTPLSAEQYESLIEQMKNSDMDVMHGAHLRWNPQGEFGRALYSTVNEAHRLSGGGEPLLRFVARRRSSTIAYADSWSSGTGSPDVLTSSTDSLASGTADHPAPPGQAPGEAGLQTSPGDPSTAPQPVRQATGTPGRRPFNRSRTT